MSSVSSSTSPEHRSEYRALTEQLNAFLQTSVYIDDSGNLKPTGFFSLFTASPSSEILENKIVAILDSNRHLLTSYEDVELVVKVAQKCGLNLGKTVSQRLHSALDKAVRSIIEAFGSSSKAPISATPASPVQDLPVMEENILSTPEPEPTPEAILVLEPTPPPEPVSIPEPTPPPEAVVDEITEDVVDSHPPIVADKIVNTNTGRWKTIAGLGLVALGLLGTAYYMMSSGVPNLPPLDDSGEVGRQLASFSDKVNIPSVADALKEMSKALVPVVFYNIVPSFSSMIGGMQQANPFDSLSEETKRSILAASISQTNPFINPGFGVLFQDQPLSDRQVLLLPMPQQSNQLSFPIENPLIEEASQQGNSSESVATLEENIFCRPDFSALFQGQPLPPPSLSSVSLEQPASLDQTILVTTSASNSSLVVQEPVSPLPKETVNTSSPVTITNSPSPLNQSLDNVSSPPKPVQPNVSNTSNIAQNTTKPKSSGTRSIVVPVLGALAGLVGTVALSVFACCRCCCRKTPPKQLNAQQSQNSSPDLMRNLLFTGVGALNKKLKGNQAAPQGGGP